jgi:glycosyltransferase involved in cell wall biosynthesis
MKILVLSDDFPPFSFGGAGMIAFRATKEFVKQGHQVYVVTSTDDKTKVGVSQTEGMIVHRIYSKYHERWRSYVSIFNPGALIQLKKIIFNTKPDVVHAHNIHAHLSYASLLLARKYVPKVFMTAHDMMAVYPGPFAEFIDLNDLSCPKTFDYRVTSLMMLKKFRLRYNPLRNLIIKKWLNKINGVVAVSDSLKEGLLQNGVGVKLVIHNGIDISEWSVSNGEAAAFKKSMGLEGFSVVLFGGRLSGVKGGNIILEVMNLVSKQISSVKLFVVGKKDFYAKRMEEKAESLGLKDKIIFAGWLSEDGMKKSYAISEIVVVPSVHLDPFPTVNLESFAVGKPVVATCFGGSPEIIKDGENGFVVNPLNITAFADAICEILSNKEKAREFGEAGHRLVAGKYRIEEMAGKYLSLFSE